MAYTNITCVSTWTFCNGKFNHVDFTLNLRHDTVSVRFSHGELGLKCNLGMPTSMWKAVFKYCLLFISFFYEMFNGKMFYDRMVKMNVRHFLKYVSTDYVDLYSASAVFKFSFLFFLQWRHKEPSNLKKKLSLTL